MFITKKRWEALVKRVADLEKPQSRPQEVDIIPWEKAKTVLQENFYRGQINGGEYKKLTQFIDEIINH